eukprot:jgi/Chrzof1/2297/Cz11g10030.t1
MSTGGYPLGLKGRVLTISNGCVDDAPTESQLRGGPRAAALAAAAAMASAAGPQILAGNKGLRRRRGSASRYRSKKFDENGVELLPESWPDQGDAWGNEAGESFSITEDQHPPAEDETVAEAEDEHQPLSQAETTGRSYIMPSRMQPNATLHAARGWLDHLGPNLHRNRNPAGTAADPAVPRSDALLRRTDPGNRK